MKTRPFAVGRWAGLAVALTLLSACDRNPAPPAEPAAKATPATTTQLQLPEVAPLVKSEPEPPVPDLYLRKLRPPLADVVKLAQFGTAVDVIRAYIIVSTNNYDLSDAEIAYLGDLGLAPEIILEMLVKDGKRPLPAAASPQAPTPPAAPETPPLPAPTSAEYQVFYATTPASVPVETSYASAVEELPPIVYYDPPPAGYAEPIDVRFESELADYGTWVEVPDHGRCWRPNAVLVNPNWRPYCDGGRWVYSECGWYWQSDYTWGWAAFHYGRWHRHTRHGWLWQPGRLWAPAWVSWRVSAEFFGWAPLPPGAKYKPGAGFLFQGQIVGANFEFGLAPDQYTFVPVTRVKDPNWMAFALQREAAREIAGQTRVSNYYRTKNNRVVNLGKDYPAPAGNIRAQEVQVLIRDLPPTPPAPPERITRQGNHWVIYRKLLPTAAQTSRAAPPGSPTTKPVAKTRPVEPNPSATAATTTDNARSAVARMLAEQRATAERMQAEIRRLTEERAQAEAQAQALAEEKARQQLEARRQAEARAAAERARFEETARQRAEEEHRAEMARRAEAERLAAEQAAERARAEEHARRRAEEEQQAEEARRAEARRVAEERARSEELARQRAEAQRQAEAARQAEARRQAEERAKAEEHARRQEAERQAEAARQAEARRVAEAQATAERARAEEARRQAEERSRREAEERSKRDSDEKTKDKK